MRDVTARLAVYVLVLFFWAVSALSLDGLYRSL